MATRKALSKTKQSRPREGPVASRPQIQGYGIQKSKTGLLTWDHVRERMAQALHYWVCTTGPGGQPHATPVDGLWIDDRLYFGGMPNTRRHHNLAANPAACVHLESGMDVVILQGVAHPLPSMDRALAFRMAEASAKKYGYGLKPEEYQTAGVFAFRPRVVFAWKNFPKDATRWHFRNGTTG